MRISNLLAFLVLPVSLSVAASWPQWRGPDRNGVAADSPPLTRLTSPDGLPPLWVSEPLPGGNEGGWGSPVIADGRVYLYVHIKVKKQASELAKAKYPWLPPDKRGHLTPQQYEEYEVNRRDEDEARGKAYEYRETLHCFDAATGKSLWQKSLPSVYTRFQQSGTAAVIDGRVYVHGAARVMRCLDGKTGEVIWQTKVPGEFRDEFMMSSFAVADGVAVVLDGHLVGLDVKTGAILWQGDRKATSGTHSSPVVWRHAGRSYFIANVGGNSTACFEPATGKELWRVRSDASQSTPVIAGDVMVTLGSSRRGGLRCYHLSLEKAEEKWVYTSLADPGASPVVVGNFVYAQGEKRLACVDLATGDEKWATDLKHNDPRYTSLIAADNKVLYACEGLLWFAADPTGFKVLLDGRMDDAGLVASEPVHRRLLKIDQVSDDPKEQEKADKLYRGKVGRNGPLQCSSPAMVDGKLFVRLKQGLACYELTGK